MIEPCWENQKPSGKPAITISLSGSTNTMPAPKDTNAQIVSSTAISRRLLRQYAWRDASSILVNLLRRPLEDRW